MRAAIPLMTLAAACARRAAAPAAPQALPASRAQVNHLLSRLAFGARPGQVDEVQRQGTGAWVEAQLAPAKLADPEGDAALRPFADALADPAALMAAGKDLDQAAAGEAARGKRQLLLATQMTALARHVMSRRQVLEVMTDFWTNHFNVSALKGPVRYYAADFVERAIRPHALGRFVDLLTATARHPAMLLYLDNARSRGKGLNENYARELLELHTLGVHGGYSQDDVVAVARILTGWSVARATEGSPGFVFRARAHDAGERVVMGQRFPAGGGEAEGRRLLAWLAEHPATIEHVSRRLCMRLGADEPPAVLVEAAVHAWRQSDGDIGQVVRAVVGAPAFWSLAGQKIKSPLETVVSAARVTGATIDGTGLALVMKRLGQPLLVDPVPTGYSDAASAWLSTAGAIARMNLALAIAGDRCPGLTVDVDRLVPLSVVDVPRHVVDTLLGGSASAHTVATISRWMERARDAEQGRRLACALALGSPEFQRQ